MKEWDLKSGGFVCKDQTLPTRTGLLYCTGFAVKPFVSVLLKGASSNAIPSLGGNGCSSVV